MELLTYNQLYNNLKRTIDLGLISLLNKNQLEELALKYFGVKNSNGEYIGYECPYSGKLIKDSKDIVLEHIIPVEAKGGTVLFNCIPTSKEVNGTNEKGAKHLISWWTNSKYWDSKASKRLEKLVNYIIEAYEIVFKEYKENTIQYSDVDFVFEENADLTTTSKKENFKIFKDVEESQIYTYYGFLNDCICCLEKNNIDTTFIKNRLNKITANNIFEEVEMYVVYQNILNDIIKKFLCLQDRSELNYTLRINIVKLMNSINSTNTKEISKEIINRCNNIKIILEKNGINLISFFEDIKNQDILYRNINDISEEDVLKMLQEINLCVEDKFNKLFDFIKNNNGLLPNKRSKNHEEKMLAIFARNLKRVDGLYNNTILTKERLKLLHDSDYEVLKNIYKIILFKAIANNVSIDYIDTEMADKIKAYMNELKECNTLDENINVNLKHKEIRIDSDQFYDFVNFVIFNNGRLPSGALTKTEEERKLGSYRNTIQSLNQNNHYKTLSKEQLEYLHNSEYESLRNIYKTILYKSIEKNILIDYIDELMASRIRIYLEKTKGCKTLEEKIELNQRYNDIIIENNQFNEFVNYVIKNNGKMPNKNSNDDYEKTIGEFRTNIQLIEKRKQRFKCELSKEQLEYLHNSEYESLKEIYKNILFKAISNNINITFIDKEMEIKIKEYLERNLKVSTIEEKNELNNIYKDYIIIGSQFEEFISFVLENNGTLPNKRSSDEKEKSLGIFKGSIKRVHKTNSPFRPKLSKEQLEYLYKSNYKSLNDIYDDIMEKAYEINYQNYIKIDLEIKKNLKGKEL